MSHSMQCPRCQKQVGVAEGSEGQRVKCPHCNETFVVPGFAAAANDDDDWLMLDDAPPAVPSGDRGTGVDAADQGTGAAAGNASADHLDDDFGNFDFNFDSDLPSPANTDPAKRNAAESFAAEPGDESFFDDLPPVTPAAKPRAADSARSQPAPAASDDAAARSAKRAAAGGKSPPVAQSAQHASEYRVKCPDCESLSFVKADRAGKMMKCHDCYTDFKVPPPPKIKKTPTRTIDMETVEAYQFEQSDLGSRPDDPFRKSARELLDAAEHTDQDEPEPDFDIPRIRDWAANVFGAFLQPSVIVYWLILSLFASVPSYVALRTGQPILIMGLFPAGIFFAAIVMACGFAILQSVANQEETIQEWPVLLDPTEWIGPLLVTGAAVLLSGLPAWLLGQFAFGNNLATVCLTMFSIYLLFPFVLLSMLDMQSVMVPFSPEVARSVTKCQESWGGFYFSSGLLFFATFMVFFSVSLMAPPVQAVFCIFTAVAATFVYFSMLGRLAYSIGQAVNDEPLKNDIDRSRRREETPE